MLKKRIGVLAISVSLLIHMGLGYSLWRANHSPPPNESEAEITDEPRPTFVVGSVHQSDHLPFNWAVYDDPERPEFWDDGDGMPPRPFRFFAAHPTDENKAKLLAWLKKQHEVMEKVSRLLGQDRSDVATSSHQNAEGKIKFTAEQELAEGVEPRFLWKNISLAYIYSSTCEACLRHKPVIDQLAKLGTNIIYFQTDFGKNPPLYPNSQPYTEEIAEIFPEEATPTLYLKALGHETQRLEGYRSFDATYHYIDQQFGEEP